ncbi:hypothetical protein [Lysinibacter sp. HNR]|uniref:hypothetical protein n=1 Tax=Lysinibacter sp. HNR TaxID=3031408 RepID=UPI00243556A2|nr:hypothetical protein [Lysinibacter sp. HNR]WGD37210.1 hypothetical protein FrondiHNR_12375 [Lysinibacter sp. HNR]
MKLLSRIITSWLVLLSLSPTAVAFASESNVGSLTTSSNSVDVGLTAPGHSREWQLDVTNTGSQDLPVSFQVSASSGTAFSGDSPAVIAFFEEEGTIIDFTSPDAIVGKNYELGTIASGETRVITGSIALPLAADDSYRAATASLSWEFSAFNDSADATDTPTGLAFTGVSAFLSVLLGVLLVAIGFIFWLRRRRTDSRRTQESTESS